MYLLIGILAGIIFVLGDIPYVLDTLKHKTKPHRLTWFVFFTLDIIYLFNQVSIGATNSLWLIVAWTIVTGVIFLLSLKNGIGGFSRLDLFCLLGVIVGLLLWWIFKTPLISILCNILVSMVGYIPTIKKAYFHPETETKISWFTAFIAAALQLVSVGGLKYKLLILPTYSVIMTLVMSVLLNRKLLIKIKE